MSQDTRFVLHLGAHKTATSVLQRYMWDNRPALAQMNMVPIRRSRCSNLIGYGWKPAAEPELLRGALLEAADTKLVEKRPSRVPKVKPKAVDLGPVRTVVVSHENSVGRPFYGKIAGLYPKARECAEGFVTSIGDLPLRVVYYIRSQESFLESYYLQTVHQGSTDTFEQWFAKIDPDDISWRPLVDALVETFGRENVVIRDFAEIREGQNAYIRNFLRICDPSVDPVVDYPEERNLSVSQLGLEIALLINSKIETPEQHKATRYFLQSTFNNRTGPRPLLLTDDQKSEIRQRYAAENAEIVATLGATPAA